MTEFIGGLVQLNAKEARQAFILSAQTIFMLQTVCICEGRRYRLQKVLIFTPARYSVLLLNLLFRHRHSRPGLSALVGKQSGEKSTEHV